MHFEVHVLFVAYDLFSFSLNCLLGCASSLFGGVFHQEARVLAQALKVGRSPRHLRPLPASRRRHLRAEILEDIAAVEKVRLLHTRDTKSM